MCMLSDLVKRVGGALSGCWFGRVKWRNEETEIGSYGSRFQLSLRDIEKLLLEPV